MELSVKGENYLKILATNCSPLFNLHCYTKLLQFFCSFQIILLNTFYSNAFFKSIRKVTFENCGTQTTKPNLARHKESCSAGTLYCTQCPNFFTKSQNDLNYRIAEKHSASKPDVTFNFKLCYQEFPGFYALRQHRNTQHGLQIGSGTRDVDVERIVGDVEDHS